MIKENFDNNGYDYVDLGLPSGTLWATMNVGASNPLDCGLYFQWGDTQGYRKDQIGKDKPFTQKSYKWYDDDKNVFTKYTYKGATLELEDDAAHVHMGGDWHMPTKEQIKELIDNTTREFETLEGVSYMALTSKKDSSKYIFFPAAGYAWEGTDIGSNTGYVWSSVLHTCSVCDGDSLSFDSRNAYLLNYDRYDGHSVRGVIDKNDEKRNTIMNENFDLRRILKDVPKGTKLWSPICGECEFNKINNNAAFPIECLAEDYQGRLVSILFTDTGVYDDTFAKGICVLFPSKENHDWSTFKVPKKHKEFKPFQKVLVKGDCDGNDRWTIDFYSFYDASANRHYLASGWAEDEDIIPYEGNEDKLGKILQ